MHEIHFAERVREEAEKMGASKGVKVEVGELAEISAGELEEALKGMVDWDVDVRFVESKIKCDCGFNGRARILDRGHGYCVWNCPVCSRKPLEVLQGGEIKVVGVE
ncbi:MAG: hydrogenase maturation nickel metallochaperone HypA [Nanoarchaeota archaeon]|nr:hydrogenase maturation nickel metallochaperone HypA [Nanoarchaeota archaeon]MBU1051888.1 hydrogenase maturation nickel metallochaperone HypA [Nanoarchaeota archaeon]MBU1988504.1 hydrogenase maturation nickel metallochaperone HypA [Nanoarchaeota archaeon]